MPNAVPVSQTIAGSGYQKLDGRFADVEEIVLFPAQTFAEGVTVGPVFEMGARRILRLRCAVTAKSGTNPTLDVTIQTSRDGLNGWETIKASDGNSFAQKTNSAAAPNDGLIMGAVTSAGSTPPVVTLTSSAQVQPVRLRVEATDIATNGAARGQWIGRYSVDGGVTWVTFLSAATVSVVDPNGTDTGVVINIAAGNAATDNVWTALTVGFERKVFAGVSRFVRAVALIGGSATPTMSGYVRGEAA